MLHDATPESNPGGTPPVDHLDDFVFRPSIDSGPEPVPEVGHQIDFARPTIDMTHTNDLAPAPVHQTADPAYKKRYAEARYTARKRLNTMFDAGLTQRSRVEAALAEAEKNYESEFGDLVRLAEDPDSPEAVTRIDNLVMLARQILDDQDAQIAAAEAAKQAAKAAEEAEVTAELQQMMSAPVPAAGAEPKGQSAAIGGVGAPPDVADADDSQGSVLAPPADAVLPAWVFESTPLFKRIRDDALALRINPDAVLLTDLARIAVLAGPIMLRGFRTTPLGVFVVLAGRPGAGKGAIQDLSKRHLPDDLAWDKSRLREAALGTGPGLCRAFFENVKSAADPAKPGSKVPAGPGDLQRTRDALWIIGREGGRMGRLGDQAPIEVLESMWSGEDPSLTLADKDRRSPLQDHSYVVAASLCIQPGERVAALYNPDTIGGGFAHRLSAVPAQRRGLGPRTLDDTSQITPLDWQLPEQLPGAPELYQSDGVRAAISAELDRIHDDLDGSETQGKGHLPGLLAKWSALVALAGGTRTVTVDHLDVAREIVALGYLTRDWLVGTATWAAGQAATEKGRIRGIEAAATGHVVREANDLEERLLRRLFDHARWIGVNKATTKDHVPDKLLTAGPSGKPLLHCCRRCLDQLVESTRRLALRRTLDALVAAGRVVQAPAGQFPGRRSPVYRLDKTVFADMVEAESQAMDKSGVGRGGAGARWS